MNIIKLKQSNKIRELTGKFESTSKIAVNASNKAKTVEETLKKVQAQVANLKKKEWVKRDTVPIMVPIVHEISLIRDRFSATLTTSLSCLYLISTSSSQKSPNLKIWSFSMVGVKEVWEFKNYLQRQISTVLRASCGYWPSAPINGEQSTLGAR